MVKVVQNSFLGGQLDWEMMGRQDIEKYSKGATLLKNFSFLRRGAISKRPGTDFIADLTARIGTSEYRVIPFSYLVDRGYVMVLIDKGAFFVSSDGTIIDPSCADGEEIVPIPYTGSELGDISYVQVGDVMFIAHPNHPPARIQHTDDTRFIYSTVNTNEYLDNIPAITGLSVARLPVTSPGGQNTGSPGYMTEFYRVTSVTDGVESLPSPVKSVGYYMPWTESQVINISVSYEGKPDRINIYKLGSGVYGLIGILQDTRYYVTSRQDTTTGIKPINEVDSQSVTEVLEDVTRHSLWNSAWYSPSGSVVIDLNTKGQLASDVSVALGYTYTKEFPNGDIKATFIPTMAGERFKIWVYTYKGGSKTQRCYKAVNAQTSKKTEKTFTVETYGTKEAVKEAVQKWSDGMSSFNFIHDPFKLYQVDKIEIRAQVLRSGSTSAWVDATGTVTVDSDGTVTVTGRPLVIGNVSAIGESALRTSFKDNNIVPDASITPPVRKDVFSKQGDYPSTVAIYQQRLVWAGSNNDPARIWMSKAGDLYSYAPHEQMVVSDPIDFILPITRFAKINFITELRKLLIFSDACEWVVGSSNATQGVSYESIMAVPHSFLGCDKRLQPIVCNNSLLFCERTGQDVRRYGYQLEDDGYGGTNISILASSIFDERRIKDWAYQQHPDSTVWSVLSDGTMAMLAWMEEQEIIAWGTAELGGDNAKVTGIANTYALCGTSSNYTTDEVFLAVERGTGEGRTITLERMRVWPKEHDTVSNAVCLDSVKMLKQGDPRREGAILIDPKTGRVLADIGENGGIEGYPFTAEFISVYPIVGNQVGCSQFDLRTVQNVHLRTMHSCGGTVRAYGAPKRVASPLHGKPLFDGDGNVALPRRDEKTVLAGVNDGDGRIIIEQDEPYPFTLLMLETDIVPEVQYK